MKKRITALMLAIVMVLSMVIVIQQPVSAATTKVATTAVNLRNKPTTIGSYSKVVVPEGAEVTVYSTSNGWSKARYKKGSKVYDGYLYAKYLKNKSTTPAPKTEVRTIAEDLYMRSSKSTASTSNIIYVLKKGAKVTILGYEADYWARASYTYKSGGKNVTKTGYIRTGHFTDDKSRMSNYYEKTKTALNLRSTTSTATKSNIIAVIPKGKSVKVLSYVGSNWYKVKYAGITGYVKGGYFE